MAMPFEMDKGQTVILDLGNAVLEPAKEKFDSDLLKGALSLDGTLGTFLGTRSNNTVFCALHRMSNGGQYEEAVQKWFHDMTRMVTTIPTPSFCR